MFVNCFQSLNGFDTYKSHKSLPLNLWNDTNRKLIEITKFNTLCPFVYKYSITESLSKKCLLLQTIKKREYNTHFK